VPNDRVQILSIQGFGGRTAPDNGGYAMKIIEGLSYDDVLLIPRYTELVPHLTSLRTRLAGDIHLNIPMVSAAMDTVTETELAIAIALAGGAGVIHRNLSPEDQGRQVSKVKRYLNWIIDSPISIDRNERIGTARMMMRRHGISGLMIVGDDNRIEGILTRRDLRFCNDDSLRVEEVMTADPVTENQSVTLHSAKEKFDKHKVEKLPVVDDQNHLVGLITVKDMEKQAKFPNAATDAKGRLIVGAAISAFDYDKRIPLLMENKVDFVVIDVAHGNTDAVMRATEDIKKKYDVLLVSGNVVDAKGTANLISAGADAVKIGVGPGASCTTRVVAGVGVPQFTAVVDSAEEARKYNIPIMADGGIKYSGDIVKALAGGANTVMLGSALAGLKESPGKEILYDGRIFKEYRGMGSVAAIREGSGDRYQMQADEEIVPEGVEGRVPYKGELSSYMHQLAMGIRKGMSYCGCGDITELQKYATFVKISSAGLRESHPHDLIMTHEPPNYSKH